MLRVVLGRHGEIALGVERVPVVEGGQVGVGAARVEGMGRHLEAIATLHLYEGRLELAVAVASHGNGAVEEVVFEVVDVLPVLDHGEITDVDVHHAVLVGGALGRIAVEA